MPAWSARSVALVALQQHRVSGVPRHAHLGEPVRSADLDSRVPPVQRDGQPRAAGDRHRRQRRDPPCRRGVGGAAAGARIGRACAGAPVGGATGGGASRRAAGTSAAGAAVLRRATTSTAAGFARAASPGPDGGKACRPAGCGRGRVRGDRPRHPGGAARRRPPPGAWAFATAGVTGHIRRGVTGAIARACSARRLGCGWMPVFVAFGLRRRRGGSLVGLAVARAASAGAVPAVACLRPGGGGCTRRGPAPAGVERHRLPRQRRNRSWPSGSSGRRRRRRAAARPRRPAAPPGPDPPGVTGGQAPPRQGRRRRPGAASAGTASPTPPGDDARRRGPVATIYASAVAKAPPATPAARPRRAAAGPLSAWRG